MLLIVVKFYMALMQSSYVTEGFGMVSLLLLQLFYNLWLVATICRPTTWLCQYIFQAC